MATAQPRIFSMGIQFSSADVLGSTCNSKGRTLTTDASPAERSFVVQMIAICWCRLHATQCA